MRVLAIDQSYTSCGIVVFDDATIAYAERYVSDTKEDKFNRAFQVAEHLRQIALHYDVDFVAMEGLAFAKNGNATRDLAGLQFSIATLLDYIEGYDIIIIPPNSVKRVATGKGNADKDEMVNKLPKKALKIFESLGVKKTTGLRDLSDAFWIGKAAIEQRKLEEQEKESK